MSALSAAVWREEWEVAAYLLLLGAAKVASRLPPETLAELVALLEMREAPGITGSTQAPRPRGVDGAAGPVGAALEPPVRPHGLDGGGRERA